MCDCLPIWLQINAVINLRSYEVSYTSVCKKPKMGVIHVIRCTGSVVQVDMCHTPSVFNYTIRTSLYLMWTHTLLLILVLWLGTFSQWQNFKWKDTEIYLSSTLFQEELSIYHRTHPRQGPYFLWYGEIVLKILNWPYWTHFHMLAITITDSQPPFFAFCCFPLPWQFFFYLPCSLCIVEPL